MLGLVASRLFATGLVALTVAALPVARAQMLLGVGGEPGVILAFPPVTGAGATADSAADFTTESGSNHYYNTGTSYGSFAAWASALGLSFSRASVAYQTNCGSGITAVLSNVLRFDCAPGTSTALGMRLEGSRTNLLKQSEDLGTTWTFTNASAALNAATAPDGAATADKLVEDSTASAQHRISQAAITLVSGTLYSFSAFGQAVERLWGRLAVQVNIPNSTMYYNLSSCAAGTVTGWTTTAAKSFGGNWCRVSASVAATGSGNTSPIIGLAAQDNQISYSGNGVSGSYYWGMQWEAGAFRSSYIKTTTASVTRAADALTRTRTSPTVLSWLLAGRTAYGNDGTQVPKQIDDGSTSNKISLRRNSDGHLHLLVTAGAVDQADLDLGALADDTDFRVACRAQASDFSCSRNGLAVVSASSGSMPAGLTTERYGAGSSGNNWFGTVAYAAEWLSAVSDADLRNLAGAF